MTSRARSARVRVALIALLVLVPCLGGCTSEPPPVTGDGSDPSVPLTDLHAAPRSEVAAGGVLTLAVNALPASFNPRHVDGSISTAPTILAPTRGSAIAYTQDGDWVVDPLYARSVRVTSTDPLTVRVELNPQARWQDGEPITSADMVAYVRALKNDEFASSATAVHRAVDEVRVDGDFAYDVVFRRATNEWPRAVYPELSRAVTGSAQAFNENFASQAVPSNGPFVVTEIDTETGKITLERNENWWGPTPRLDQIVWRVADDELQGEAWAADELDAVVVTDTNHETVGTDDVRAARGRLWSQLTLNGSIEPFDDARVRRAVAMALDRQAFAELIESEIGTPGQPMGAMMRVPGQIGPDVAVPERDVDGAKKLLAEAEVADLSLELPYPEGAASTRERVELVAEQLADVGIDVEPVAVPAADFFTDIVIPLNFTMSSFMWESSPFGLSDAVALFTPLDSNQNFTGMASDDVADAFAAATSALDPQRRAETAVALERALAEQSAIIPLVARPKVWAVNPNVVNYGPSTFADVDWTSVGFVDSGD